MNLYEQIVSKATGQDDPEVVADILDLVRHVVLKTGTLDHLDAADLERAALDAHGVYLAMRVENPRPNMYVWHEMDGLMVQVGNWSSFESRTAQLSRDLYTRMQSAADFLNVHYNKRAGIPGRTFVGDEMGNPVTQEQAEQQTA